MDLVCQPGHSYGPAVRSGYLIHYILSGKGIFRCEGTTYHLSAGDAFLIRPHTLIYYQADARQPWTYTWIGMQGIKVEEYFHRTSLMNVPCVHCGQHEESIRLCHEKMFKAYLLDVRIRQACTLLTHSDLTITNIARSVGYEDSLYFSRLFRRKKGQTPSQYRSTHQSPESNS